MRAFACCCALLSLAALAQVARRTATFDGRGAQLERVTFYPRTADGGTVEVEVCGVVAADEDPADVRRSCRAGRVAPPVTEAKALKLWRTAERLEDVP